MPYSAGIRWDHPRIRGTNAIRRDWTGDYIGSPPHTRDKLFSVALYGLDIGITPAYAGQIEGYGSAVRYA